MIVVEVCDRHSSTVAWWSSGGIRAPRRSIASSMPMPSPIHEGTDDVEVPLESLLVTNRGHVPPPGAAP